MWNRLYCRATYAATDVFMRELYITSLRERGHKVSGCAVRTCSGVSPVVLVYSTQALDSIATDRVLLTVM